MAVVEPSNSEVTGQASSGSNSSSSNSDSDGTNGDGSNAQSHATEASKDSSACTSSAIEVSSECSTSHSKSEAPTIAPLPKKCMHPKAPFSHLPLLLFMRMLNVAPPLD